MFHCTPHPGLGAVVVRQVQVDLATCRTTRARSATAASPKVVGQTIVFNGHVVARARRGDSIDAAGASPLGRWVLYWIDPDSSASLAADGLPFRLARATGGRSYPLAAGLVYSDYRTWCDSETLVMTVGVSRMAVDNKRLILFNGPTWRGRNLEPKLYRKVFGSVECAPDGNSVVVQETAQSTDGAFRHPGWSLWRVSLPSGASTRLTSPPASTEDDSPHFSPDGRTLYFVRDGWLYALRGRKLAGPLLRLPASVGYFGHTAWPYTVTR